MFLNNIPMLAEGGDQFTELLSYFAVDTPFLVAQIINFTIVVFVLYRFAVKPVLATLDMRQQKITDGLQYAEEMKKVLADTEKQHAERLTEASRKAQSIVDDAKESSKNYLERQRAEATIKVEEMFENARESIERERKKVLLETRSEITNLVVATCERVLSKNLSDNDKSTFNASASVEIDAVQAKSPIPVQ